MLRFLIRELAMKNTKKEVTDMSRYGITLEQRPIYRYKQYQYEKLQDAINFAKLDIEQYDATIVSLK